MRLPWERKARQINSLPVSTKALELETAKEILSEVFPARPADVEEMIRRRRAIVPSSARPIWQKGYAREFKILRSCDPLPFHVCVSATL